MTAEARLTTSCAKRISTYSGVDAHTSKKRISVAWANVSASCVSRKWNRRTTSLPYRASTRDEGERSREVSLKAERGELGFGTPHIDSISQSRNRIHGRRGQDGCDKRRTGSMGGGGVMLEPAGTAETMETRVVVATRTSRKERR